MRISELLFQFLIDQQKLSLPNIGVIYLKTPISSEDLEDNAPIPEGYLEFKPDPTTPQDDALIAAIASGMGKIKALAAADLESFIINGQHMMNISKPFIIDRVGVLERNYKGEISFLPAIVSSHGNKKEIEEVRFDDNYLLRFKKMGNQYKKLIAPMAGLVVLFLIFWFGYYFFRGSVSHEEALQVSPITTLKDTTTTKVEPTPPSPSTTTDGFYIIVAKAPKDKAFQRFEDLKKWGHNVDMITKDSITFHIRIPIKAALSDSTKHKDSLTRFFGKQVWVEQH